MRYFGLSNTKTYTIFNPDDNLSRAMLAQILYNKEGKPVVNYLMQFADVSSGEWYAEAVRWAASIGIITGIGNGLLDPSGLANRAQAAQILKTLYGYPFYSARNFLESVGFGRLVQINELVRGQMRISVAKRTHSRIGQTVAPQRFTLS